MKRELSILIPTYNDTCTTLVDSLNDQARQLEGFGLQYEIIVADDGSTDVAAREQNRVIASLSNCRYIERSQNSGRAVIRNFLAREARYAWLLFLDCDMTIRDAHFLSRYLEYDDACVIDGGVAIGGDAELLKNNLRYRYEKAAESMHTADKRQQNPYRDFHTANFFISRDVMLKCPFDVRFRHYGYEDVLMGKQLRRHQIKIAHIDNPAGFDTFEDNGAFVSKTEEGLRTLHQFRMELRGYSQLLTLVDGIHIGLVKWFIRLWHRLLGPLERRILCGRHPSLLLFKLYKLGYYLSLTNNDNDS